MQGFRSAAQVPASYFERRKRVRVRVANVIAAAPPVSDASGNSHHPVDLLGRESREGELLDPTLGGKREMGRPRGSDGGLFWCLRCQVPYSTIVKRAARTRSIEKYN